MSRPEPSPREMARGFTPRLAELVENPLYSDVWADPALSPRDRSIATVAALIALYRPEELPAHFRRARNNGVTCDGACRAHHTYCVLCRFPCGHLRVGDRCTDADGLTKDKPR
jgi:alkylhydroperoxidase/carboxymuconolactone decarboxylase family protein YurZ